MLLAQEPKVLLVDEPVAGMTHAEMERTGGAADAAWRASARSSSSSTTWSSCAASRARVTVLHEGRVLAEGTMDEVQADPRVIEVYSVSRARCSTSTKLNQFYGESHTLWDIDARRSRRRRAPA